MPKKITLQPLGLNTNANPSVLPSGAMGVALDVALDRPGVIESAQAYGSLTPTVLSGAPGWDKPYWCGPGSIVAGYVGAGSILGDSTYWNGSSWSRGVWSLGGSEVRVTNADGTTSALGGRITGAFNSGGVDFLVAAVSASQSDNANVVMRTDTNRYGGAGMCEAITPLSYTGTPGTVSGITATFPAAASAYSGYSSSTQAAYRTLLAYRDANGKLIRGAPSGRLIVYGSAVAWALLIPLTKGQTFAGDILQVYRSETVPTGRSEPSDEMRQVWEYIIQAADVTAGYVVFANDVTPDDLRGPSLYTNDSQQGILQAEARPPMCAFAVQLKDTAFYGGVGAKQNALVLNIIGLQGWSTATPTRILVTVNGTTYTLTAATAEDLPLRKFLLDTTSATASLKLFNTARSICRALSYNNPNVIGVYATQANDLTATVVFKSIVPGDANSAGVTATALPSGTTSPVLGAAQTNFSTGSGSHYVYFSKPSQPESVPDANWVPVGNPGAGVSALAAIRDSVFVFKEDGLYRITGTTADNIRVELFDPTIRLRQAQHRAVAACGGQIFCFCNQGFMSVTESGATVLSGPIDDIVKPFKVKSNGLSSGNTPSPEPVTVGALDNAGTAYLCLTDKNTTALTTTQRLFVFNFIQKTWAERIPPAFCSGVTGSGTVANAFYLGCINDSAKAISTLGATTSPSAAPVSSCSYAYVRDAGSDQATLDNYEEVRVITKGSTGLGNLLFTFSSDTGASPETITVTNAADPAIVRCQVPRSHAQASQLTVEVSSRTPGAYLLVTAMSISYTPIGEWGPTRSNT